jgi:hypothetical protein
MPGDPGVTVVTILVCFYHFAHKAAGAASARHSPCPLLAEGGMFRTRLARKMCGEIAKLCPDVIARSKSDEAIHSAFTRLDGLLRYEGRIAIVATRWALFALLCIRFSRVLRKVSRPAVYAANRVSPYSKTDSCIYGTEFQGLIAYNSQRRSRVHPLKRMPDGRGP